MSERMITVLGPTASGKTRLAVALASDLGAEIISADSRQVYCDMDIGTGKDLADYVYDGHAVPHHLIDIVPAGTKYNLYEYQKDFHTVYDDLVSRSITPILCGGTGLYIEAVLGGYSLSPVPQNPELRASLEHKPLDELTQILIELKAQNGSHMHNRTDVDTCQRAIRAIEIEAYNKLHRVSLRALPPIESLIIGLHIDREERRRRITERLRYRLEHGLIEEVKELLDGGIPQENLIYYGLEYKYVTEYVTGLISFETMFGQLETAIHQFAKRQMTWFRGMERRGYKINWIDATKPLEENIHHIKQLLWQ